MGEGVVLVNDKGEENKKLCYRTMSDGHAFLPDILSGTYSEIILSPGIMFHGKFDCLQGAVIY